MSAAAESVALARRIRAHSLRMVARASSSHIGSCLSAADVLAVLYADVLRVDPAAPTAPARDRFVMSKGHAAVVLYAVLAESGFFPVEQLDTFGADGSALTGHISHALPGVEVSTGSLGHGLPISVGMAMALRADGSDARVFCLLSDGECDEGSNWEAILFAPHHRLGNLVVIVDYNKIQSFGRVDEVLELEPFAAKWSAFGWSVQEVDGHDHGALRDAFGNADTSIGPAVVIAHTVKGRGVSFMENTLAWHYRSPSPELLEQALEEVERE